VSKEHWFGHSFIEVISESAIVAFFELGFIFSGILFVLALVRDVAVVAQRNITFILANAVLLVKRIEAIFGPIVSEEVSFKVARWMKCIVW